MPEAEQLEEGHPPRGEDVWVPNDKQELFLRNPTTERMYGGAAGGGKTDALLIDATTGIDHPNHRALLLRRTWKDLQAYVLPRSFELYEPLGGHYYSSSTKGAKVWLFPSGATVQLGASDNEAAIRGYAGAPYNWIGFDELTHFTEWQYLFLFSRLRSAHGLPLYFASATNPGGPGHDWVLNRWAPWLYPRDHYDYHGPWARPGRTLYFRRKPDGTEEAVPRGTRLAMGRTFIPARVSDNPFLAGTDYEISLAQLPLLDRLQLEQGDWMARPAKGMFFKREWFQRTPMAPALVAARLRYWDLASTSAEEASAGTAFTAGMRLSAVRIGTGIRNIPIFAVFIEDIVRGQWSPGTVERMIAETAGDDARFDAKTVTYIERDPGQAGKAQAWTYSASFASMGLELRPIPPQGDKLHRARLPSGQAEARNIFLVAGNWIPAFLAEAESFPEGLKDQIDALSGGIFQLFRLVGGTGLIPTSNLGDSLPKPARVVPVRAMPQGLPPPPGAPRRPPPPGRGGPRGGGF